MANVIAGAFLLAVPSLVIYGAWTVLFPRYDGYDVEVLVRDLEAFDVPAGGGEDRIVRHPCTGEGSVPAAASRSYVVAGTVEDLERTVTAEAEELGWRLPPAVGPFVNFDQGDRTLSLDVTPIEDARVVVSLYVSGGTWC